MNDRTRLKSENTVYGKSRLDGSVVKDRLIGGISDISGAVSAFENESIEALSVKPIGADATLKRREDIKTFIVKILLFIGIYPHDSGFPLLATALEKMANYSVDFDYVIRAIADRMQIAHGTAERHITSQFDFVKNKRQVESISYITETDPYTALDAIYDLAVYIKKVSAVTGEQYA